MCTQMRFYVYVAMPLEKTDKTGLMSRLIQVFPGSMGQCVGLVKRWLNNTYMGESFKFPKS